MSTSPKGQEDWIKVDLHIHTVDDPKDVIDYSAHQLLERALTSELGSDRVKVRVPSFVTSAFVASCTEAVGTMPARLAEYLAADLSLAIFTTPIELPRIEISQFWHARVDRDQGHRWFRSAIAALFGPPSRGTKALRAAAPSNICRADRS